MALFVTLDRWITLIVDQECSSRGEEDQGLILSFGKSGQNKICSIFGADSHKYKFFGFFLFFRLFLDL